MKYCIKKALKALGLYNAMCSTFLPKRKFINVVELQGVKLQTKYVGWKSLKLKHNVLNLLNLNFGKKQERNMGFMMLYGCFSMIHKGNRYM